MCLYQDLRFAIGTWERDSVGAEYAITFRIPMAPDEGALFHREPEPRIIIVGEYVGPNRQAGLEKYLAHLAHLCLRVVLINLSSCESWALPRLISGNIVSPSLLWPMLNAEFPEVHTAATFALANSILHEMSVSSTLCPMWSVAIC